jgi:hypothetical protein
MEELSTEQMTSLRGGAQDINVARLISAGNVGIAIPINIEILSNNATGVASRAGQGDIGQNATPIVGNQFLTQS